MRLGVFGPVLAIVVVVALVRSTEHAQSEAAEMWMMPLPAGYEIDVRHSQGA